MRKTLSSTVNVEHGDQVIPTEHTAKTPSPKTGLSTTLRGLLGGGGSGAPSRRCAHFALAPLLGLIVIALTIVLTAAPVLAAPPASFGEEGTGAGRFNRPSGIAVEQASGDVYINDAFNSRVDKFGPEGKFLLAFGWGVATGAEELQSCGPESVPLSATCRIGILGFGPGQLSFSPSGVAVDNSAGPSHGDVYILDDGNRVEKFGPHGEFLLMIGGGVDHGPHHPGNLCTAVFIAEGDTCGIATTLGSGPGEFERLGRFAITVDSTGTLYVGDNGRIQKFSPAGAFQSQIALPGAVAERIAVDSAGDIYVIGEGLTSVHKYDPTGTELGKPRDPAAESSSITIAIGAADQLLLTDEASHHVEAFNASGQQIWSLPEEEEHLGGLAYGNTIERIYVLHEGPPKVILLSPPPPGPLVLAGSEAATEIGPTTANLNATVNPEGGEETSYRFQYVDQHSFETEGGFTSPNTKETTSTKLTGGAFEDQPASTVIASLQTRTTYDFRVIATNKAKETTQGPGQIFTTLPPVSIDSTTTSQITATSAQLEAELNPHGLPTTYHFEYDTAPYTGGTPPHGTAVPIPNGNAGSSTTDIPVSAPIQGLAPATTYHFRLVAENSSGKVEGLDRAFETQGPAGPVLPDNRGWELVSPPDKNGVPLAAIAREGADIQAAADGSGLAYVAKGSIGTQPPGNRSFADSQLLAHRSALGWSTQDVTPAHEAPQGLIAGHLSEYQLFSSDLSLAAVEPEGATQLSSLATERTPYLRGPDGSYSPLVSAANVPPGTKFGGTETKNSEGAGIGLFTGGVAFVAANPDLSAIVLTSQQDLTDPAFAAAEHASLYRWSAGALELLSQVPARAATRCGGPGPACVPAAAAGLSSELGEGGVKTVRDAISANGNRAVFVTERSHIWLRDTARAETVQLDVLQPGAEGGQGAPVFQTASADGSRVFFSDASRLTSDSTAQPAGQGDKRDLYECEIEVKEEHLACVLTDLTANTTEPTEPADVLRAVIGASEDGSSVYYIANGALAPGAVRGNCETIGEPREFAATNSCNLYLRRDGQTIFIAAISNRDALDWGGALGELRRLTARVSPNGRWLAFMSERPLTGYDNRDAASGQRDEEVFLYDSQAGNLICSSCNPTGARPTGVLGPSEGSEGPAPLVDGPRDWLGLWRAANLPAWSPISLGMALYQSRYLSDSGRLFFNSSDALVPQDSNGTEDVYEYEPSGVGGCTASNPSFGQASGGCVGLISSGTSGEESAFVDASESGSDVFFLTASKLAPSDVDSALDVYDAHVCTAESSCPPPPPPSPPACAGDACQSPVVPPSDPTPGSLTFNGPGNLTSSAPARRVTKKTVKCKRGFVKNKKGRCVRRKKKAKKASRATNDRRAKS